VQSDRSIGTHIVACSVMTSLTAFLVLAALAFSTEARASTFRKVEYFTDSGCSEADKKHEKYDQLGYFFKTNYSETIGCSWSRPVVFKFYSNHTLKHVVYSNNTWETVREYGHELRLQDNSKFKDGCFGVNHANSYYRKVSCFDAYFPGQYPFYASVQYPVYTDDTCTTLSTAQGDTAATGKTTEQPVGVCSFEYGGTEGNWTDTATSSKFTVTGSGTTVLYQEFATADCSGAATSESSHTTTDCFLKGGKYYKYAVEKGWFHPDVAGSGCRDTVPAGHGGRRLACSSEALEGKSLCWLVAAGVALVATMF